MILKGSGNITGLSTVATDLAGKRVELLREAARLPPIIFHYRNLSRLRRAGFAFSVNLQTWNATCVGPNANPSISIKARSLRIVKLSAVTTSTAGWNAGTVNSQVSWLRTAGVRYGCRKVRFGRY
jgi:hypothetical protein